MAEARLGCSRLDEFGSDKPVDSGGRELGAMTSDRLVKERDGVTARERRGRSVARDYCLGLNEYESVVAL